MMICTNIRLYWPIWMTIWWIFFLFLNDALYNLIEEFWVSYIWLKKDNNSLIHVLQLKKNVYFLNRACLAGLQTQSEGWLWFSRRKGFIFNWYLLNRHFFIIPNVLFFKKTLLLLKFFTWILPWTVRA